MNEKRILRKAKRLEKKSAKILKKYKKKRKDIVSVYFGVPGAGKTTLAAWLVKQDLKHHREVYSNVPITGAYKLDVKDLGVYHIENASVIVDEAGIEWNNRNYKSFPQTTIKFLKYHRHYQTSVDVFSQSYEDMDITVRRLAQRFYVVRKSRILPFFIVRQRIGRKVGINEVSKDIIDEYSFVPFGKRYIFCPVLWKMFNTLSREQLKPKEWEKW